MPKVVVERKGRMAILKGSQYFRICGMLSLLFCALSGGLIVWRLFPGLYGQDVVPLHYNIHYGVDWTGVWWQIFTLPVGGLMIVLLHAFLTVLLVRREPILAKIVSIATVVLTALLFIATVFVVLLNLVYG
jgi:hypothetical protein